MSDGMICRQDLHEMVGENRKVRSDGYVYCRECARIADRKRRPPKGWTPKTHCPQQHEYTEENTYVGPAGYKQCRTCQRARSSAQAKAFTSEEKRARWLKRTYDLTIEEYDALSEAQNGVCAICNEPETRKMAGSDNEPVLVVDHDHGTGEIRGLLCHRCNSAIGLLREDPRLLDSARDYLGGVPCLLATTGG